MHILFQTIKYLPIGTVNSEEPPLHPSFARADGYCDCYAHLYCGSPIYFNSLISSVQP